jgi:hypothetical protein
MFFIWDDWNEEHIARHGVEPFEAEHVVLNARRPSLVGQGPTSSWSKEQRWLVGGSK